MLDIVQYKQSITLIFDIQFSKWSFNIIYFIIRDWVAKAIKGVQHDSRSCFPLNSYAKLNVFDGFGLSTARSVNNILPQQIV